MKLLFLFCIGLFFAFQTQAQPIARDCTFSFELQVIALGFKKGKSNFYLKQFSPVVSPGSAITRFEKDNFREDTLAFEVDINHVGHIQDTISLELFNSASGYTTKIVFSANPNPAVSYQIDLTAFTYPEQEVDGYFFFDMLEINALLKEQDSIYWKGCVITQTHPTRHNSRVHIKVQDLNIGKRDGFFFYSYHKIQAGSYNQSYRLWEAKNFFSVNPDRHQAYIIPQNTSPKTTIVAEYKYLPSAQDKRNRLFGHQALYTFYSNHTFKVEIHNPPTVVSLQEPRQDGFGIWEVEGDELYLMTPVHWLPLLNMLMDQTSPIFTPINSPIFIKGKRLIVKRPPYPYRLKQKRVKGQKGLLSIF